MDHGRITFGGSRPEPAPRGTTEEVSEADRSTVRPLAFTAPAEGTELATRAPLRRPGVTSWVLPLRNAISYAFSLLFALVLLELVLSFLRARESSPFKRGLDRLVAPFLRPFEGLLPDLYIGPFRVVLSYVAAVAVYALLRWALERLIALATARAR